MEDKNKRVVSDEKKLYWKNRMIDTATSGAKAANYHTQQITENARHSTLINEGLQDKIDKINGAFTDLLVELHKIEIGGKNNVAQIQESDKTANAVV